jgi:nitroreductase
MMQNKTEVLGNDAEYLEELNGVDRAIASRFSARAFLPDPVPQTLIRRILDVARWAPSGSNMQPWRVYVATGAVRDAVEKDILDSFFAGESGHERDFKYYPDSFFEPYIGRRRACGIGLYQTLGIAKGETEKIQQARARNFRFFDAPVGLFFTLHRDLQTGSWLDLGMFLQSIMVSARGHGLHSCPQAAFATYHKVIRPILSIPDDQILACGMSLGYADPDAVVNGFRPEREPVDSFATFHGFEEGA